MQCRMSSPKQKQKRYEIYEIGILIFSHPKYEKLRNYEIFPNFLNQLKLDMRLRSTLFRSQIIVGKIHRQLSVFSRFSNESLAMTDFYFSHLDTKELKF